MIRAALLALLLAGCAAAPADPNAGRYLSAEEDANLRAQCEPAGGCAVVPAPIFRKLMQALQACRQEHSL